MQIAKATSVKGTARVFIVQRRAFTAWARPTVYVLAFVVMHHLPCHGAGNVGWTSQIFPPFHLAALLITRI